MNIPLAKPDIGPREIASVVDVLNSGRLSLGPRVPEFEERFAEFVGSKHAIAVSSGTAALHLCVRAFGIGQGDEVVTTSFSFVASTNCILFERATPVFLDIDPNTLNISPAQIERFLEEQCEFSDGVLRDKATNRSVKAILPVHVFGYSCDMDAICEIAARYRLVVIEDACEAVGSYLGSRHVGTFGAASVFAFYPNKQITTAEGGMIVTDDAAIAAYCRSLRNQGRDLNSGQLTHVELGYNYRLSDLHAALGSAQLSRISEILAAREMAAQGYFQRLAANPSLLLPHQDPMCQRGWFVYVVRMLADAPLSLRERVMNYLQARGIGCQAYFPAIHRQPYIKSFEYRIPYPLENTEDAASRCVALPFFTSLSSAQIEFVCDALQEAMQSCKGASDLVHEAAP